MLLTRLILKSIIDFLSRTQNLKLDGLLSPQQQEPIRVMRPAFYIPAHSQLLSSTQDRTIPRRQVF